MITRLSNAALALVLAGLSLAQEPRDPSQGYVPPRSFGPVDAKVHAGMQGIWKVEKAEWDEIGTFSGQDLEGRMLIDEGHLAYEVHASVYDDLDEEYLLFESGVSRYQFSPVGELETITMVGADNLTSLLELSTARPGEIIRFRVRLAGDVLLLDRADARFSLRRVPSPKPPFHDRISAPEEAAKKE